MPDPDPAAIAGDPPAATAAELQTALDAQKAVVAEKEKELAEALAAIKDIDDKHKKDLESLLSSHGSGKPLIIYPPSDKKLKKFFGHPFQHKDYVDIEEWLDEADVYLEAKGERPEKEKVRYIIDSLAGLAQAEVKLRPTKQWETLGQVKKILQDNFGDKRTLATRHRDFYDYRQQPSQSLREYSHELWKRFRSVSRLDDTFEGRLDPIMCRQYVENVRDESLRRELRRNLRNNPTVTFLQLREEAVLWMNEENSPPDEPQPSSSAKKKSTQSTAALETTVSDDTGSFSEFSHMLTELKNQFDSLKQELLKRNVRPKGVRKDYSGYTCHQCGKKGHIKYTCPDLQQVNASPKPGTSQASQSPESTPASGQGN